MMSQISENKEEGSDIKVKTNEKDKVKIMEL